MTPRQRRILGWLSRQFWVTDRVYFRLSDSWSQKSVARARKGEQDWRVRLNGQGSWIRATRLQYEQALLVGVERSIGVPEIVWAESRQIDRSPVEPILRAS